MTIGTTFLVGPLLIALPLCSSAQTRHEAGDRADVKDFVRGIYVEGLPYDAATEYTSEDSAVLLEMLRNDEEAIYWPNITMVLGVIGDDAAVRPLIDFIHGRGSGAAWSSVAYRGRASALGALGYHVNKSGNAEALTYLLDSADPAIWIHRDIPWLAARNDAERLRVQLSVSSVLALALTGRDEAAHRLDDLLHAEATPTRLREVAESVQPDLAEIKENGLSAYYQMGKKGQRPLAAARR